jgi:hypothetical protein
MRFQIQFDPEQEEILLGLMADLYARAGDMSPALRAVTYLYLDAQKALFEGDNHWAPLTPGTVATKERTGHNQMMVGKTGMLKGSLTLRKGSNKFASTSNTNTWALMGTTAYHAHLQALGTAERVRKNGGRTGKVTARSMAFVDAPMVQAFFALLESYLVNGTLTPEPSAVAELPSIDLSGFDQGLGI